MTIEWGNYELYAHGVGEALRELPRSKARHVYEECMKERFDRIRMLIAVCERDHGPLGAGDAAVQGLNSWFYKNVEADEKYPGQLSLRWLSVAHDVALFLGEQLIERHPSLHWAFFTWGKKNFAYQHHVIMGMRAEDPEMHININLEARVAAYGRALIASRGSIPTYGRVEVRGVSIDVDEVAARHRDAWIEEDIFLRWMAKIAERA